MPVVVGGSSSGSGNSKKISNASTRISAAGGVPNLDNRNWLEQVLNLPRNQSTFMDVLDIVQRPQQATNNFVDAYLSGSNDLGSAAWGGFTGQKKVTGDDIFSKLGIDNPAAGIAWDLILDPVNLIPGAAFAKAGKAVGSGIKATAKIPGVSKVVDELAPLFNKDWGAAPDAVARNQEYLNMSRYFSDKVMDKMSELGKRMGLDLGPQIARELERDLKWTETPEELLASIFSNRKSDRHMVNVYSGEHANLVDRLNETLRQSPDFTDYMDTLKARKLDAENRIKQAKLGGGNPTIAMRQLNVLQKDLDELAKGIRYEPLANGKGFQVVTPKPRILKNALGDINKFIDDISPKKSFDDMIVNVPPAIARPVATDLFRAGSTVLKAGSPEAALLDDFKKMFGKDLRTKTDTHTGDVTLRLAKGSEYHGANLDELEFTDRIKEINIERPERAASTDPRVQQAVQEIQAMVQELRDQAAARGITMSDSEGWLHHTLSPEQRELRASVSNSGVGGQYGGNGAVRRSREYKGSIEDINERLGKNLFDDNAFVAAGLGLKKNHEYVEAQSHFVDLMEGFAKPYTDGKTKVPDGYDVIQPKQYRFFPTDSGGFGVTKGDKVMVPKAIRRYLDHAQGRITDENIDKVLKGYDKVLNLWKGFQFFSPAFHVRNDIGSKFNMWIGTPEIGGMSWTNIVKYQTEAMKDLAKSEGLVDEFARQGLRSSTQVQNEFRFGDEQALIDQINGKTSKNPFTASQKLGDYVDVVNKYTFYKWLRNSKNLSPEQSAKVVRTVLFDYADLTNVERQVIRRAVPFYTWMKKNAVFQIASFIPQMKKYSGVDKAIDNLSDDAGLKEGDVPEWLREALAVPLGDDKMLNLGLPMADLNKLENPVNMVMQGLTPGVKAPLELWGNYDFFRQKPIEDFKGELDNLLGMDVGARWAHAGNQLGLLRNASNMIEGEGSPANTWSFGMIRDNDPAQNQKYAESAMLKELEDMIRAMKQQGVDVPTMRELAKR